MEIKNLTFSYGDKSVFDNLNLNIEDNKTTCVLGVSGCGKTTLLNCIGGLLKYQGEINNLPEKISYVFQEPNLISSLTVRGNLEYVLGDFDKTQRNVLIKEALKHVELEEYIDKYPKEMSGGQKSRVALSRAFVYPSSMILMDEPFTGLDIALKSRIITLFNNLLLKQPKTVIYVTHSIDEALLLADNVYVMDKSGNLANCISISLKKSERNIASTALADIRGSLLNSLISFSADQ